MTEQFTDSDLTVWSQERTQPYGATSNPWRRFVDSGPSPSRDRFGFFLQPTGTKQVHFIQFQRGVGWRATSQMSLPDGVEGKIKEVVQRSYKKDSPDVVLAKDDGSVQLYNFQGLPSRSFTPDAGANTVPVAARLKPDEAISLVFFTPENQLVCYRSDDENSAPSLRWSRPGVGIWSLYTPMSQPQGIPLVADITTDPGFEILIAEKPDRLVAINSEGKTCHSWTFPALPQQWQVAEFDGDEFPDLLVTYPTGAIIDVDTVAVCGRDGKTLWKMHCGNGPTAIADVNADGIDDVVMRDLFERRILDGRTGRDLQPIEMTAGYHTPILAQDSDHRYDGVLWGGGTYSIGFNDRTGRSVWKHWYAPHATPAVTRHSTGGKRLAGSITAGQIYQLPELKPLDSPDKELLAHDLDTGELQWRYALGATAAGIVTADADGDGRLDFLVATVDGRLMAIATDDDPSQRVIWEVRLPGSPGVPIVCDDGTNERMRIVISCSDGRLYCLMATKNE